MPKYKQQADGRYRTKVWDGTYKNGAKHYTYITSSKSSKDLERLVAEYEQKRNNGHLALSSNIGIQEYALQWMQAEKGLSENATRDMYNNVITKHLKAYRDIPFEYLTRQSVQLLINEHADRPRTCQQIVMVLKQVCKSAERDRLLPSGKSLELFDKIQIPKYKAEEKKALTNEQCSVVYNAIVTHILPPRSELFLSLIYFLGLRREEALALKYEDVHSLSVSINKALHVDDPKSTIKTPKTERGHRTIPIPQDALPIIGYCLKQIVPNSDGYLFTMQSGDLMSRSSYSKMWKGIEKNLGFKCTAHVFRHNYCTRLCYEAYEHRTISVKQIARLLGDTEKMVTDVYSHLVEEKENTTEALASVFGTSRQPFGNHLATNDTEKWGKMG